MTLHFVTRTTMAKVRSLPTPCATKQTSNLFYAFSGMIHLAVEAGHVDMCLYLIVEKKLDVNVQDRNGWTPLHVCDDQLTGTSISFVVSCHSNNVTFQVACSNGDCKAVASLLSTNKCDVTLRTFEGATVLHYLVRREPEEGLHESYFALVQQLIGTCPSCNVFVHSKN